MFIIIGPNVQVLIVSEIESVSETRWKRRQIKSDDKYQRHALIKKTSLFADKQT